MGTSTGTFVGGATTTAGKFNNAFSFNGSNYVSFDAGVNNIEGLNAGSLSIWFKTAGPYNGNNYLFGISKGSAITDYADIYIGDCTGAYTDDSLCWVTTRTGAVKLAMFTREGQTKYTDNQWHHLVVVTGNGDDTVYVDNAKKTITYNPGSAAVNEFTNIDKNCEHVGCRQQRHIGNG